MRMTDLLHVLTSIQAGVSNKVADELKFCDPPAVFLSQVQNSTAQSPPSLHPR